MQVSAPAAGVLHWYYTGTTPKDGTLGRSGHSGQHQLNIDTAPQTTPLRVPPRLDHTNTTLVRRQPRPKPAQPREEREARHALAGQLVPYWYHTGRPMPRASQDRRRQLNARQYHTCTTPTPPRYGASRGQSPHSHEYGASRDESPHSHERNGKPGAPLLSHTSTILVPHW